MSDSKESPPRQEGGPAEVVSMEDFKLGKVLQELREGIESDPDFADWAREKMKGMDLEARRITLRLGLPPEAKYTVLGLVYDPEQRSTPHPDSKVLPFTPKAEKGK